ncbi:hypothetical protein ACSBPH_04615 [Microbacterium sp. F51-2R]
MDAREDRGVASGGLDNGDRELLIVDLDRLQHIAGDAAHVDLSRLDDVTE